MSVRGVLQENQLEKVHHSARQSASFHAWRTRIFEGCSGNIKCKTPSWNFSSVAAATPVGAPRSGRVSPINKLDRGVSYFFVTPLRQRAISRSTAWILFTIRPGEIYYGIDFPHGRSD